MLLLTGSTSKEDDVMYTYGYHEKGREKGNGNEDHTYSPRSTKYHYYCITVYRVVLSPFNIDLALSTYLLPAVLPDCNVSCSIATTDNLTAALTAL